MKQLGIPYEWIEVNLLKGESRTPEFLAKNANGKVPLLDLAQPAVRLCVLAAGVFFLTGLLTGVWKYLYIARSANASAPVYVDITHRSALLYSFAAIPLAFFALAIGGYVLHGLPRDTDNQFEKPHRVGARQLPLVLLAGFMWLLALGEIGGFLGCLPAC